MINKMFRGIGHIQWRLLDGLYLLLLAIYVLAGTPYVPFHGDESTIIWMSRDFGYIFLQNDVNQVRYHDFPPNATEQHLRLLNGTLTRYLIGVSWFINGYQIDEINEQWDWGAGWDYNLDFNHAPDDTLLMLGRWPSAMMLAMSSVVMFAIGWQIAGRPAAYIVSIMYVLNPVVLLNGRRVMFEGGLLLFTLLVVLAGISTIKAKKKWLFVLIGLLSGLAATTKHSAVISIFPLYLAIAAVLIWEYPHQKDRKEWLLGWTLWGGVSCVVAFTTFYILNPIWWGDPIMRISHVIEARSQLLNEQISFYGSYSNGQDQLAGLLRQMLAAPLQYFEVNGWDSYIGDQISRYENTIWSGLQLGGILPVATVMACLIAIGFSSLYRQARSSNYGARVILIWAMLSTMIIGIATPLEWQRYYLILQPIVALIAGLGILVLFRWSIGMVFAISPLDLAQDKQWI